jgi:hypothetical protein
MIRRAPLRALALLALLAPPATAIASGPSPVRMAFADVLGESVRIGSPDQPRSAILFFMSRRSKDVSTEFARAVDERLVAAQVDSIAIVDVRRYGGLLRGLALSRMRKSEVESREHRRVRRLAHGVDASPEVVSRWHLIADFDGSLFTRFGVEAEPSRPIAFLVDPSGSLRGPYTDADALCAAYAARPGSAPSAGPPDQTRASVVR